MTTQKKSTKTAPNGGVKTTATVSEPVKETVAAAQEQVEKVGAAAQEQVEKVSAAAQEQVEKINAAAEERAVKTTATATQDYDDFAALQKDAFDAFVRSGEILAKGAESLGKEYLAFAQDSVTAQGEAAKALLAARSLQEVMDLQGKMVRTVIDKSVDEGGKLSEMSLKIAADAFEPVQKQLSVAVEVAMKPRSF